MNLVIGCVGFFGTFTLFFAQGGQEWWGPLSGAGVAGVVLYWFMTKAEHRMREGENRMVAIENSNNRTTRAILMLILMLEEIRKERERDGKKSHDERDISAHAREAKRIEDEIAESEKNRSPAKP